MTYEEWTWGRNTKAAWRKRAERWGAYAQRLETEVEKLRAAWETAEAAVKAQDDDIDRFEEENERLRDLTEWRRGQEELMKEENERLREHGQSYDAGYDEGWAAGKKRGEAENERLRDTQADVDDLRKLKDAWKRRFEEQKEAFAAEHAEVEALKALHEETLNKSIAKDMEIDRLQADLVLRQNEKELLRRLAQQNGADVERLRKELQWLEASGRESPEAHAALDRLEAELQNEKHERRDAQIESIERGAEVERLRAVRDDLAKQVVSFESRLREQEAEVERLRKLEVFDADRFAELERAKKEAQKK